MASTTCPLDTNSTQLSIISQQLSSGGSTFNKPILFWQYQIIIVVRSPHIVSRHVLKQVLVQYLRLINQKDQQLIPRHNTKDLRIQYNYHHQLQIQWPEKNIFNILIHNTNIKN